MAERDWPSIEIFDIIPNSLSSNVRLMVFSEILYSPIITYLSVYNLKVPSELKISEVISQPSTLELVLDDEVFKFHLPNIPA